MTNVLMPLSIQCRIVPDVRSYVFQMHRAIVDKMAHPQAAKTALVAENCNRPSPAELEPTMFSKLKSKLR